ncbi:baculoviral IAP repeat-containing protein 2-like [Ruditapes philippinarum]|uniref:baculoviral IAP repeat-containing protein 2-like n=1 Tax=Ruditapes philippinarum TaxID=129788 RepID=UPI00295BDBB7|nr:baculoviral IAP repeat-containing protein 2-like [Ruditapes philippinarum]
MASLLNYLDNLVNGMSSHTLKKYEWARLESYGRIFPIESIHSTIRLAKNGFYYLGIDQLVRCFCCEHTMNFSNENSTDIREVHLRLSPNCTFARGLDNENVPIDHHEQESNPMPEIPDATVSSAEFGEMDRRVSTFVGWPAGSPVSPGRLAAAGFLYTGFDDHVRCFCCGIGVREWQENDDPWVEHARWSITCPFVKYRKGEDFIQNIQRMLNATSTQETVQTDDNPTILQCQAASYLLRQGYSEEIVITGIAQFISMNGYEQMINSPLNVIEFVQMAQPNLVDPNNQTDLSSFALVTYGQSGGIQNSDSELYHLRRRVLELETRLLCKVCLQQDACILFLPCGHMASCIECSHALNTCAICRAGIQGKMRVFPG